MTCFLPPPHYNGRSIWKFWKEKIFSCICGGDKLPGGELKLYGGVMFSTTLSLFHFFRNSQHPEKISVSFNKFFRKCECIRISWCYLPISSNLIQKAFRKTSIFVLTVTGVREKVFLMLHISNYCNSCDQNPWKISVKKISFRKEFLETLCKYIYLEL